MSRRSLLLLSAFFLAPAVLLLTLAGPGGPRGWTSKDFNGKTYLGNPRIETTSNQVVTANKPNVNLEPQPIAVAENSLFNFGTMEPLTTGTHSFVIRNNGTAPLILEQGPTTCKCTLGDIKENKIAPGEYGHVVLEWNTGRDAVYRHTATIYTNDPKNSALYLTVEGRIRSQLVAEPAEMVFTSLNPESIYQRSFVVASQSWDNFELLEVTPTLAGIECEYEPIVDETELHELSAKSGYRVTFTLPKALPAGYMNEAIEIRARHSESEQTNLAVPIKGKVLSSMSVFGKYIETDGTVDIGHVELGTARELRMLVKIRDELNELNVTSVETRPASLEVEFKKYNENKSNGLYELVLNIPADAPRFRPGPTQRGELKIQFDHPRVPSLTLPLLLIIDKISRR